MFDVDEFVAECKRALSESEPRIAIKEVLERAVSAPDEVAKALPVTQAEIVPIYAAPDLSILKVVWGPDMKIPAHNHLMWAAIGLYGGQEDNALFRRKGNGIIPSGGRELRTSEAVLFGDDTIHSVHNPLEKLTAAIHIYGGDLTTKIGRSEWDEETMTECPMDFDRTRTLFAEANARYTMS